MATAHPWDKEFEERIRHHQQRRGPQWKNIEEERELSKIDVHGSVVLIDCLTLWATNFFFDNKEAEIEHLLTQLKSEFDRFTNQEATFIFVTNEIGMGGVSPNVVQRKFTDLLGWLNQYVAEHSDEVILMVSGIPIKLKNKP